MFGDRLGVTVADPDHSFEEERYLTVGHSSQNRLLIVAHAEREGKLRIISARELTEEREKHMKQAAKKSADELRPEYDLASLLKRGVKGKYTKSFEEGTNLVLIEPQIHREFKTDQEVNDALRLVVELRKIGGARRRSSV